MSFNYDDAFPERWLHAADLQGKEVTLTITKAYLEELRLPGGSIDQCAILSFAKTEREYVLEQDERDGPARPLGNELRRLDRQAHHDRRRPRRA